MKKIKYLILVSLLVILTGCTPTVNITIEDNYKIKEEVSFEYDNIYEEKTNNQDYLDAYLSYYKNVIEAKEYNVDYEIGDKTTLVKVYRNSDSFCDTLNASLLTHHLYDSFRCEETSDSIIIESIGNHAISKPQNEREFNFNNLTINIELPLKAEDNNADNVKGKTYTWKFDEHSLPEKSIKLVLNKTKMENKKNVADFKEENKDNVAIIILSVIIVGVIIAAIYICYKKYKETHDEY